MNIDILNSIPLEIKYRLASKYYLNNKDLAILSQVSKDENDFVTYIKLKDDENRDNRLISICKQLPLRRGFLDYEQKSDIKDLSIFKRLVLRDIPFKAILNTILATTTINIAFLYINKLLTSAVMGSILSFSFSAISLFSLYAIAVVTIDNYNSIKNLLVNWALGVTPDALLKCYNTIKNIFQNWASSINPDEAFDLIYKKFGYYSMSRNECVKLALKFSATIAFFYRNEIPRVIMPLFKSSAWTASYFLGLHWLTAEIFMKFRRCQNPYPYFMALQLFIISFCLFRNAADNF